MKTKNRKLNKIIMVMGTEKTSVCFKYTFIAQDNNPSYRWYTLTPKQAYKLVKRYNSLYFKPIETTIKTDNTLMLEWYKWGTVKDN